MQEPILKTKLIPPHYTDHFLFRKNIMAKMENYHQYKLTLINAGPGYGKSNAVSMFLTESNVPSAWLSVSEELDSISFIKYTIYAIREAHPSFGEECLNKMEHSNYQGTREENLAIWLIFLNSLFHIGESFILVFDDVHTVQQHYDIRKYLEIMLNNLPKNIHLILISRNFPSIANLSTLVLKGQVLEINHNDLAFSKREIKKLFTDSYQYKIPDHELDKIYEKTEGWIIAVQMIYQGLIRKLSINDIFNKKANTMEGLFQFLVNEIFARLPENIKSFIKITSILPTLNVETCRYLIPLEDINEIISYLYKNNLFVQLIGNNEYRYHLLFREFILSRLTNTEKNNLHILAYQYYRQNNNIEEMLHHIKQIDNQNYLTDFLNNYGIELMKQGRADAIYELLMELNESQKNAYPLLWTLEADINRLRCKYDESINFYRMGRNKSLKNYNNKVYIRSLAGEARVYLDTVQPSKAESLLKEAIRLCHREQYNDDLAYLYALYSENQLNLGNAKVAEKLYKLSLTQQHEVSRGNIEVRLHLRTGRINTALNLLEKIQKQEEGNGVTFNVRSHRETSVLLSIISAFTGDGEKTKRSAQQGIQIGREMKSPFLEAVGWMRLGHAVQILHPGEFNLALASYETAIDIIDELGVEKGKVEPLMGLCLLYGYHGEIDLAVKHAEHGIKIAEKVNDQWFSNILRLSLAIAFVNNGRFNEAKQKFMEAFQELSSLGDQFSTTVIWMWLAYIAFNEEDWEAFEIYAKQFIQQMNQGRYQFLIQQTSLFGPRDLQKLAPFFIEIKRRKLDNQGTITNWLIEKKWLALDSHPGYTLHIQMFGEFRVWLGDNEVKNKDWQREKAKLLFQLLVTRRHELLNKEWIIGQIWPESKCEKQANRDFKVVLNALNKVLEPNRPLKTAPFFVQRHGSSYGFNMTSGYVLDVELFETNVLNGLQDDNLNAYYSLEKGLSYYKGDFLPEQLHADWTMDERERLQILFLRGAEKMARIELENKNYTSAINWGHKIINIDPTWEEAYHIMMLASIEEGNRTLAIKLFHKCKDILKKEIGVAPMPELIRLYETLIYD